MQAERTAPYFARGSWLMGPQYDGEPHYLLNYFQPEDAERAARDLNRNGRAESPETYRAARRRGR